MAGPDVDLERLFTIGPRSRTSADSAFTDRREHAASFIEALGEVRDAVRTIPDLAVDLHRPRRNVLVFYGMGGIGKTTLSKELQRRFDAGEVSTTAGRVSARIDLGELASIDPELLLLRLRGCLGHLTGRLPAFDLVLAAYWERKHPGDSLAQFLDRRSGLGRASESLGLSEQIQAGLESVVGGMGVVGTAWRAGSLLRDGIVRKVTEARLFRDCPFFEPLLREPSPDEARPFLPALLAWELARYQRDGGGEPADVVVFLDTWESLRATRDEAGGVEDTLNRLVFLMPNVLFVISGRSKVTWADPDRGVSLKYVGPGRWPGLAEGTASRQYLVGRLSPEDSDAYLRRRLSIDGTPAIPEPVRRRIVEGSDGMPLYLDLSAEHYDELLLAGTPDETQFGGTLPQLVTRVVRDLAPVERQLLRAASLVSSFSADLLRAAVPDARDADVARFGARHFVKDDRAGWLRWSIHESLRASVRKHDGVSGEPWSHREWTLAANRILAFLADAVTEDLRPGVVPHRERVVEAFRQGFALAAEFSLRADWLLDLAFELRSQGSWEAIGALSELDLPDDGPVSGLAFAALAAFARELGDLEDARRLITKALDGTTLDPGVRDRIVLERAEVQVRSNQDREAEVQLRDLAARPGPLQDRARYWLSVIAERQGRLADARAWIESDHDATTRRHAVGMRGWLHVVHGRFDSAVEDMRACLELTRAEKRLPTEEVLRLEHLAWVLAWSGSPEAAVLAAEAMQLAERLSITIVAARARVTLALARSAEVSTERTLADLREGVHAIDATGYHSDAMNPLMALAFVGCRTGAPEVARDAVENMHRLSTELQTHAHLCVIGRWWLEDRGWDVADHAPAPHLEWLEPVEVVRARWVGLLHRPTGSGRVMPDGAVGGGPVLDQVDDQGDDTQ